MELRHLRYFVAVAEELHFRKAAEKLHIVQPALSKQISALEAELGLTLLDRDRRHVTLTDAGRTFLDEAVAVLARVEGAMALARATDSGQIGHLNIGFIQPALAEVLPRSLRSFRAEYPDVRIRLAELASSQALEQVASRTVDCAFTRFPIEMGDEFGSETISEQNVDLVLPEGHPLTEKDEIAIEDIAGDDLVMIDRRVEPALHDYYIAVCHHAGFSPRISHEVNSTSVALGLVASGLGVTFAPASASLVPQRGIAYRRIAGEPPKLTMGLVWNAGSKPAVLENFLRMRPWELVAPQLQ